MRNSNKAETHLALRLEINSAIRSMHSGMTSLEAREEEIRTVLDRAHSIMIEAEMMTEVEVS